MVRGPDCESAVGHQTVATEWQVQGPARGPREPSHGGPYRRLELLGQPPVADPGDAQLAHAVVSARGALPRNWQDNENGGMNSSQLKS